MTTWNGKYERAEEAITSRMLKQADGHLAKLLASVEKLSSSLASISRDAGYLANDLFGEDTNSDSLIGLISAGIENMEDTENGFPFDMEHFTDTICYSIIACDRWLQETAQGLLASAPETLWGYCGKADEWKRYYEEWLDILRWTWNNLELETDWADTYRDIFLMADETEEEWNRKVAEYAHTRWTWHTQYIK